MMLNKNVINVAKFSFINSLKSKVFIVFNVIILLCMLVFFNFNTVKEILNKNDLFTGKSYDIEVEDVKGLYYDNLVQNKNDNINSISKVEKLEDYTLENIEKEKVAVKIEYVDTAFNISIISKEKIDGSIYDILVDTASSTKNQIVEKKYSISQADADLYRNELNVNRVVLNKDSVVEENNTMLTFVMTMIIYFLIMFGTNAVASQIANEKTSKSAEYIFSSIPAKDYLHGKVLGANLKTLINMLLMIFYVIISISVNSLIIKVFHVNQNLTDSIDAINVAQTLDSSEVYATSTAFSFDSKIITYIGLNFIFIILTSILLSYMQAGITAKVKSISDLDSSQSLSMVIIIVAYFLAFSTTGINNLFTKILANIPIFSMFLMPINYLNDVASKYMVILSLLILVLSIMLVIHFVSRTFKKNILDLGNRSIKETVVEEDETKKEFKIINKKNLNSFSIVVSIGLILLILIQSILGVGLTIISTKVSANIYNIILAVIFVLSIVIPIFIINNFTPKSNIKVKKEVKEKSDISAVKLYFIGFAFIFVIQYIGEFIIDKFSISSDLISSSMIYDKSILGIIILIIQMAILPGIFEELLFRKAILSKARRFGNMFAIIFSSVAFGLIHLNLAQGIVAVLIGIVFSYIAIKAKTIKIGMALHITNNLIATLSYVFEKSTKVINIINIFYIAFAVIGVIILILTLIQNRKNIKNLLKLEQEKEIIFKASIKDVLFNYYSIILFLFIAVIMYMTY